MGASCLVSFEITVNRFVREGTICRYLAVGRVVPIVSLRYRLLFIACLCVLVRAKTNSSSEPLVVEMRSMKRDRTKSFNRLVRPGVSVWFVVGQSKIVLTSSLKSRSWSLSVSLSLSAISLGLSSRLVSRYMAGFLLRISWLIVRQKCCAWKLWWHPATRMKK